MSLFRFEVFESRKEKLHGRVHMVMPVSWQAIGILMFIALMSAILFLAAASYSRIETVNGVITPRGGLSQIVPPSDGVISAVNVTEGQLIAVGDSLVEVGSQKRLTDGSAASTRIAQTLSDQGDGLGFQQSQIEAARRAEELQLLARIAGLKAEIARTKEQLEIQDRLIETASEELSQARSVLERGFISKRDVALREETYLTRVQQSASLEQSLTRQRASLQESLQAVDQGRANANARIAALESQQSEIELRKVNNQAAAVYQITAPVSGQVSALTARIGQAARAGQTLMAIVPEDSPLIAELYVPSAATGFLEIGQDMGLALEAYPYQRFGTVRAKITSIASAPMVRNLPTGEQVSVFLVSAELSRTSITAFGDAKPLGAGMSLTATIVTERQSLLRWLFEPLFAIRNR